MVLNKFEQDKQFEGDLSKNKPKFSPVKKKLFKYIKYYYSQKF